MRGEFEKQVQQKMEELQLTPSAPVWEKVQLEISPEKDRRRLLLWLPVCVLLLGGSAWWILHSNSREDKAAMGYHKSTPAAPFHSHQSRQQKNQGVSTEKATPNANPSSTITLTPQLFDRIRRSNADRQRAVFTTALQQSRVQRSVAGRKNTAGASSGNNTSPDASPLLSHSVAPAPFLNSGNGIAETTPSAVHEKKVEKEPVADSAQVKPAPPAPKPHSKWTFGISAFSGLSGVSTGSNVFTKSLATDLSRVASYSNTAVVYIPPSTEQNNSGFGIGLTATRPVSRRVMFTTGLQYSLYSTRINVGQKISGAALASATTSVSAPPPSVPSSYYAKAINGSDYINRYHFLTIPVGLQYQLFRRTPLVLSASLSAQRLLGTNALRYDNQSQIYYEDKAFLKKTQVFSDFGIYYSMIRNKKLTIQLGPEYHYGLTDLKKESTENSHHVFSLGISSKILFHQ